MKKDELNIHELEDVYFEYKKLAVSTNCEMIKHLSQDDCNDDYLDELLYSLKQYLTIIKMYNQIIVQKKILRELIDGVND